MNGVLQHILLETTASLKTVARATLLLRKIKRRISDHKACRQFELESKRLLGTSPHLLEDIGLVPAFELQKSMQRARKAAPERPEIKRHIGGKYLMIQEREDGSPFDRPSVM